MHPDAIIAVTVICDAGQRHALPATPNLNGWLFVHQGDGLERHMTYLTVAQLEARKDEPGWGDAWGAVRAALELK